MVLLLREELPAAKNSGQHHSLDAHNDHHAKQYPNVWRIFHIHLGASTGHCDMRMHTAVRFYNFEPKNVKLLAKITLDSYNNARHMNVSKVHTIV